MRKEQRLNLPEGYRLDSSDPETLYLRRPDGWPIATFSADGAAHEGIERAARGDHRRRRDRPR